MDRVQRNGGTAGIVAGVLLIVLFFLFMSLQITNAQFADPGFMVPLLSKNPGTFMGVGIVGALVAGFAVVFSIGLVYRLREKAPTRALASLYLAVLGLGAHAADSMVDWIGTRMVGLHAAKDAVAAGHAYVAVSAVALSLNAMANAFTGAALLVAAWAIIATGALRPLLGWVAVVAGVLNLVMVFGAEGELFFIGSLLFTIIWLVWAGFELRRGPMMK